MTLDKNVIRQIYDGAGGMPVQLTAEEWKRLARALEDRERLRAKVELLEIETAEWKRLVEDSCGCIPLYPDDLPEDFNERWAEATREE